jgi:peptide/nickel transport system substrate-binding protein
VVVDLKEYGVRQLQKDGMSRRQYMALLGAATSASIAGCSGGNYSQDTTGQTTEQDGSDDEETDGNDTTIDSDDKAGGTFTNIAAVDFSNLDPAYATPTTTHRVLTNVFDHLFRVTRDLEIVPHLATDYTTSDDDLVWEITLREGVQFHPPVSRELTAEDVVFTYERLRNEETGSPHRSGFTNIADVSAPDTYTVRIEHEEFTPAQLIPYATEGSEIVPEEAVEDLRTTPVGTGPFQLNEYVSGDYISLTPFEDYWQDEGPYLDEFVTRVIPDEATQVQEFLSGGADMHPNVPAERAEEIENTDGVSLRPFKTGWYDYIGVNHGRELTGNKKVRHAISEAIDRNQLLQGVYEGYGNPTQNPYIKDSPWHVDYNPYSMEANPERAAELLSEAGYDNPKITITSHNGQETACTIIQQYLNQAGFDADIELYEWGTFLDKEHAAEYDIYVNNWPMFLDPETMLRAKFHTDGGFNWLNYSNEELDQLLEEGAQTADFEERYGIYEQAQKMIVDDCPYIYYLHWDNLPAFHDYVKGYEPNPYAYSNGDQRLTWLDK